jgi:hypothetical protein
LFLDEAADPRQSEALSVWSTASSALDRVKKIYRWV